MSRWILDKSAHVRLVQGVPLPTEIEAADLAVCEMGELEWLYSARSSADYTDQIGSLRRTFASITVPSDVFDRVRRLQRDLAEYRAMWHRTALPDLFIAETALHHDAGILHVDRGYARIAAVRPALRQRQLT